MVSIDLLDLLFIIYLCLILIFVFMRINKKQDTEIVIIFLILGLLSMYFCFNYLILALFHVDYLGSSNYSSTQQIIKFIIYMLFGLPSLLYIFFGFFPEKSDSDSDNGFQNEQNIPNTKKSIIDKIKKIFNKYI